MKIKTYQLAATFGVLALLLTTPAYAAPITYNFSGTLTDYYFDPVIGDPFGGTVGVGTAFTGFYTFESTAVDVNPDPQQGGYHAVLRPYGMEATIGGNTILGLSSDMLIDVYDNIVSGTDYLHRRSL